MRLSAVLFLIVIVFNCYQTALAQSKNETAKWISNKGEEILRDITGNSSIQWQMDAYGRLKITNYKPKKEEEAIIVKRYSYLNLYELDWKGGLLRKSTEEENKNKLLLRCKALSKACIKSRYYTTATDFNTFATTALSLPLNMNFDRVKAEELKNVLLHAIKLFQENN